jgi:hypothetical protein
VGVLWQNKTVFAFPSLPLAAAGVHHIYMRLPRMDTAQLTLFRTPSKAGGEEG